MVLSCADPGAISTTPKPTANPHAPDKCANHPGCVAPQEETSPDAWHPRRFADDKL